jgi:hypothetical protein
MKRKTYITDNDRFFGMKSMVYRDRINLIISEGVMRSADHNDRYLAKFLTPLGDFSAPSAIFMTGII